jgi:hypothetical protein
MRPSVCISLILTVLTLAGCDSISRMTGAPSKTSVPSNMPAGGPPGERVAVCYGGATSSMAELAAAAAEICKEPGSTVEYLTSDLNLNDCPLLKKRRAVFVCHAPR